MLKLLTDKLFSAVSIASLVVFRLVFGLTMIWEVQRYFDRGWIENYWVTPIYNFRYPYFTWLEPLPGDGMVYLFYGLGLLAIFITLGLFYRPSTILFFIGFSYSFLLEQGRYLNHFYFVILLSFLLIFLPCHRAFSFDALWRKDLRSNLVPAWTLWLLRFQVGVIYFFGGVAKLNRDWLRGEPMREWLAGETDFPLIGRWFEQEWMVYFFSYGGLLLDLFAVPLLLYRRTRVLTFFALVLFHFNNDYMFSIGIFPWMSILATTIFFPPDWPLKVFAMLRGGGRKATAVLTSSLLFAVLALVVYEGFSVLPLLAGLSAGAIMMWQLLSPGYERTTAPLRHVQLRLLTVSLLALWVLSQCLIPLRHYAIPGHVSWTEEGHRFAWHMKLRDKESDAIFIIYDLNDPKITDVIDPQRLLTPWQYSKMASTPHMLWQFARYLEQRFIQAGYENFGIRVNATSSLNGRAPQNLIAPDVNLLTVNLGLHNDWIVPLDEPLKPASLAEQ